MLETFSISTKFAANLRKKMRQTLDENKCVRLLSFIGKEEVLFYSTEFVLLEIHNLLEYAFTS